MGQVVGKGEGTFASRCRGIFIAFLLLPFAIPLAGEETKPYPDAKDGKSAQGIGPAVADLQGRKEEVTADSASQATITDDGWQFDERSPTERYKNRLFHINMGGSLRYDLSLSLHQKKDPDGEWKTVGSSVGMPCPSYCNWYPGGFFSMEANNRAIQTQESQVEVEVVETGARGIIDFTWEHPLVTARTRFLAEPGQNHLLMEMRWEGRSNLKTLKLSFGCFPQGYAVAEGDRLNGLKTERRVITPTREIPQVQKLNLNPSSEWWFLYHDVTLEKARAGANFSGPCGLVILPEDFEGLSDNPERVHLDVDGYQVFTSVDLDPGGGRARFALWDFADKTVAQAKEQFLAEVPKVRERMVKGSWLPTAIQSLNVAAERARIDELTRKLGPKTDARLSALRQQLDQLAAQQKALSSSPEPIRAERELNAALTRYRTLWWQVERAGRKDVRVLLMAGPTAYAWRVEEVVKKRWGANAVRRGAYNWRYWVGHRVNYFPGTLVELYSYDVVVLADFPGRPFTADQQQWLADFVKQGGGLLMLGGYYTYSAGGWTGSPLEPLFPVELKTGFDLQAIKANPRLKMAKLDGFAKRLKPGQPLPSDNLGCAYWRHNLKPKDGTAVWLTAGDEPFAVVGTAGEGRVMTILGAALGEAPSGQTAFWDAPGWAPLLERTLEYLVRGE